MKTTSIQTFAVSLAAASMLVACGSDTSPIANLPVEYAAVSVADLQTAEAMSARCTEDEGRFREHLSILEAFDGTPTVDDYYQSLDSLLTQTTTQTIQQAGQWLSLASWAEEVDVVQLAGGELVAVERQALRAGMQL